jgi:transcriptional regulator with XRE-family HTH domain
MGRTARSRPARLAEKLLQIRVSLGLSQNDMIRRLGLSDTLYQSNISGFELSEREPSLPILLRYAQVAGVYVDVLIDDQLDLPVNLPCQEKNSGIMRGTSKNKKK